MNGCFYIFHIESKSTLELFQSEGMDFVIRVANAEKSKKYLSQFLPELNSKTIKIDSEETLNQFIQSNPQFIIDANGYDSENFNEIYKKEESNPVGWKYGQLGIWASNYIAWLNFLKTDYDYVMLVEDDVYFKDNSFEVFEECFRELPEDWEIYHFCVPKNKIQLEILSDEFLKSKEIGKDNISLPYIYTSNACYIINRKGIEKLLKQIEEGIFLPLDWHWFKQGLFKIYSTKINIDTFCDIHNLQSTHWETQSFKKLSIVP